MAPFDLTKPNRTDLITYLYLAPLLVQKPPGWRGFVGGVPPIILEAFHYYNRGTEEDHDDPTVWLRACPDCIARRRK